MRRLRPAACTALALVLTACAGAPGASGPVAGPAEAEHADARLGPMIEAARTAEHIPALSVSVRQGGDLVYSEAFGRADLENDVAATPETLFRIGSVSKILTGTLAARLADAGRIDLDRDIREYVDFPDKGAPITLRQLLGHLAGIRHYLPKDHDFRQPGGDIDTRSYATTADALAIFADDPLLSPPGTEYHYSTFSFTLAAAAMEAATGESYVELLQAYVLAPADIHDIKVDDRFAIIPNRAEPYDLDERIGEEKAYAEGAIVNSLPLNSAYKIAGGGFVATADALTTFGALHYAPGFLSPEMFAATFTPQKNAAGEAVPAGLAWQCDLDANGHRRCAHRGTQQGARAYLAVYPDDRLTIAVLSNLGSVPRDVESLTSKIAAEYFAD